MSQIAKLTCKECGSTEGYIRECYFCNEPICSKHAHYISVKEDSIRGVSFKTIRICLDCKPKR